VHDAGVKRTAPLALRNRELLAGALAEILAAVAAPRPLVLELGSGTGEHAVAFARALPGADWQPSDPDPEARASIAAWSAEARLPNLLPPLDLDLLAPAWRLRPAAALLCVNVLHVAPPAALDALLEGAAAVLPPGGPLLVYGPWRGEGPPPPRLARLDAELRAHDPRLGVPRLSALRERLARCGLAEALARPGAEPGDLLVVLRRRPAAPGA
jgi:SAM-dependent methyltransferase